MSPWLLVVEFSVPETDLRRGCQVKTRDPIGSQFGRLFRGAGALVWRPPFRQRLRLRRAGARRWWMGVRRMRLMSIGRVRCAAFLLRRSLRRFRRARMAWMRAGGGKLVRLMGMAGGCFLAVGRGCRIGAGRRRRRARRCVVARLAILGRCLPRSLPILPGACSGCVAGGGRVVDFAGVLACRRRPLIRAAGRALRFALLPVAVHRQDVDQATAVGGRDSDRGHHGDGGRGLDDRGRRDRFAGGADPAGQPGPRCPWAPPRMPCRRPAEAAAGSGASAARSWRRSADAVLNARQSGQARRWARMSRRRIMRPSPSESARQTSSQRISRPSLIRCSPIRAS